MLAEGDAPRMKELGAMPVVAPDGDLLPGRDVVWMEVASKADEERVASPPRPDRGAAHRRLDRHPAREPCRGHLYLEVDAGRGGRPRPHRARERRGGRGAAPRSAAEVRRPSPWCTPCFPASPCPGRHHRRPVPRPGRSRPPRHGHQHGPRRRHARWEYGRRLLPGARGEPGEPLRGRPSFPRTPARCTPTSTCPRGRRSTSPN